MSTMPNALPKAKWYRQTATHHTKLGNKLINIARRIKTIALNKNDPQRVQENRNLISNTMDSYIERATKITKKCVLDEQQKSQMRSSWKDKVSGKGSGNQDKEQQRQKDEEHVADVQNAANEIKEMLDVALACDLGNSIHSAKLTRLGELHKKKAQAFTAKTKQEIRRATRQANDCKINGMKNISKALEGTKQGRCSVSTETATQPTGASKVRLRPIPKR